MRLAWVGGGLFVLSAAFWATGVLAWDDIAAVAGRVWPVLLFAATVTVAAELAADAGVFRALARRLGRVSRGRTATLWALCVGLAVACTAFLSLDTTAILLTPVVVVLAQQSGLQPLPFAFVTVWIANTGSLFLPVSNLTNLLALDGLDNPSAVGYLGHSALPATVALLVTVAFAATVFRNGLRGRFATRPTPAEPDRPLLIASAAIIAALAVALIAGAPFWLASTSAALGMVGVFASRRPRSLRLGRVPWSLLLFAGGLFLSAEAVHQWFLAATLGELDTGGNGIGSLLAIAGSGLLGANLIDNLPAYLLLEPLADSADRMLALLAGVNAGAIITPWASLATLLWHSRMESLGLAVPWRTYVKYGAVLAPVTVTAAVLAIAL